MTLAKPVDREQYARHTKNKMMMNPTAAASAAAAAAATVMPTMNPYAGYLNFQTLYQPFMVPNLNPLATQNIAAAGQQSQNIRYGEGQGHMFPVYNIMR